MRHKPASEPIDLSAALKQKILNERAGILARPLNANIQQGTVIEGLSILLSDETYILDSQYVVEVLPLNEITPLPGTPAFLSGIINVRGRILSVINLKNFLGLPEKGITNLNRVIVVKNEDIELGLLADEVTGYQTVRTDKLQKELPTLQVTQKEFVTGITPDGEIVFNLIFFYITIK